MMHFIVETGLTRRLVEADDLEDAQLTFIQDHPIRGFLAGTDEVIEVRVATDAEVAEFTKRKRGAGFDDQISFELEDKRNTAGTRRDYV